MPTVKGNIVLGTRYQENSLFSFLELMKKIHQRVRVVKRIFQFTSRHERYEWPSEALTMRSKPRRIVPEGVKAALVYLTIAVVISLFWLYSMVPKKEEDSHSNYSIIETKESLLAQRHRAMQTQQELLQEEHQSCKIPILDPFESTIMKTMEMEPRSSWEIDCGVSKIFSVDSNWTLMWHDKQNWNCCYRGVHPQIVPPPSSYSKAFSYRHVDPTLLANYDVHCVPLSTDRVSIPKDYEFISVECWAGKPSEPTKTANNTLIYQDMFGFVPSKRYRQRSTAKVQVNTTNGIRPSVLVIGIDQVSHMQFIRHFPKTYKMLSGPLNAISLFGYNKVGTTTLPNVLAMLTGLTLDEATTSCWNHSFLSFFDSCPFIWKNYSRNGYLTSFAEDNLPFSIFYNKLYARRGFRYQPTDYFYHLLSMQMSTRIQSRYGCVNNRLKFTDMMDYVKKTSESLHDRPLFQFVWGSSIFTKYYSLAQNGDDSLYSTLTTLSEKKLLENTIVFIISDHGYRFSPLIQLHQGRFESNMPAFFAIFPPQFSKYYPEAVHNFERNAFRLTTPFDFHKTLSDLTDPPKFLQSETLESRSLTAGQGQSLFLPVPLSRTCSAAGIEEKFCICRDSRPLKFFHSSDTIKDFSQRIMKEVNNQIQNASQCVLLAQNNGYIPRAQVVLPEGSVRSGRSDKYYILKENVPGHFRKVKGSKINEGPVETNHGNFTEVLVTVQAVPGMGIFEGRLKYHRSGWKVEDVVRLNPYKQQSHCVYLYKLKSFCYCKVQIYLD